MRVNERNDQQSDKPHEWGEAVISSSQRAEPGDIILSPSLTGALEPLVGRDESTPLEEGEPEGIIPPNPLWALKERRHIQWHLLPAHERHDRVRECIGSGDDAIYVIDDGRHHAMFGRRVGATEDGCEYCLVGRLPLERYEELRQHRLPGSEAFNSASEIALCGVAVEDGVASSNVFDVARYESIDEVPHEYLPGTPFIHFAQDLDITAY
jgi:hypothetical protein